LAGDVPAAGSGAGLETDTIDQRKPRGSFNMKQAGIIGIYCIDPRHTRPDGPPVEQILGLIDMDCHDEPPLDPPETCPH